jgi:hypothetical protein
MELLGTRQACLLGSEVSLVPHPIQDVVPATQRQLRIAQRRIGLGALDNSGEQCGLGQGHVTGRFSEIEA